MKAALFLNLLVMILFLHEHSVSEQCTCEDTCEQKDELGRSTWKFLHSIVENVEYSKEKETLFKSTILNLKYLYPCKVCRDHIMEMNLKFEEIKMTKQWMCQFHNRINKKLNKKEFNCMLY
jgi:FAD-linked sulfhydryl oxidase